MSWRNIWGRRTASAPSTSGKSSSNPERKLRRGYSRIYYLVIKSQWTVEFFYDRTFYESSNRVFCSAYLLREPSKLCDYFWLTQFIKSGCFLRNRILILKKIWSGCVFKKMSNSDTFSTAKFNREIISSMLTFILKRTS